MNTVVHGAAACLMDLLPDQPTNFAVWITVGPIGHPLVYWPTEGCTQVAIQFLWHAPKPSVTEQAIASTSSPVIPRTPCSYHSSPTLFVVRLLYMHIAPHSASKRIHIRATVASPAPVVTLVPQKPQAVRFKRRDDLPSLPHKYLSG